MAWGVKGVAWLSNVFLGWARMSVIAAWLLLDCLVSIMYMMYYWYFPRVTLLGRFFSWYKLYCAVAAYRALCTMYGLFVTIRRETRLVRMFYGVFMFNMTFLVWLSWPVSELQCSCESDWFQCEALQSFAEPKTLSLNRLQQPDDLKARKVRFQEPPPQKEPTPPAIMFKHKEHSERVQQVAEEARTARADAQARVQSAPPPSQLAHPPQQMVQLPPNQYQPMFHAPPGQLAAPYQQPMHQYPQYPPNQWAAPYHQPMMQAPPGQLAPALLQTMGMGNMSSNGSGSGISLPKPTSKSSLIQEHDRHMHVGKTELEEDELVSTELLAGGFQRLHNKRRNKQQVRAKPSSHLQSSSHAIDEEDHMIPEYFKIYDGVTARTAKEMPETCHSENLEATESQTARERIDVLRTGAQPHEVSRAMMKMMYLCLLDETCAALSWTLQTERASDHASQSTLCTLRAPLELVKTDLNQQPSKDFDTVFVFKDFEAAGQAVSSKETQHRMTMLLEDSSEEEANQFVEVIYRASCRCADDDSCRQYLDGQSWCYIAEETYYKCKASGYSIFADEEGKFWTSDLCSKGNIGCSYCSGIGHKPPEGDSHVHRNLLQEHKTNFGSSCDKWHDTDLWPWCFVGFDSSCVDRTPGDIDRSHFNSSYRPQFWSSLPCERKNQHDRERAASEYCENISAVESVVTILHMIGSFLMMFVLFKWISNQCGDNVKAEDMFIIESSEEEDDADDTANDDDDGSSDGDSFQAGAKRDSQAAEPNFKGKETEKTERDDEHAQSF